ncbi:hypothetical protein D3C71_1905020 [compost metagenome]
MDTEVALGVDRAQILRLAVVDIRVGAAGHRTGHTDPELFAHLFIDADDVDLREKCARFLLLGLQCLLHRGIDAEGLAGVAHADGVDRCHAGQVFVELDAGSVFHGQCSLGVDRSCWRGLT